eukprot:CAMPEP_0118894790 /NCGR_PEP_ID=MMETSP1166-20130328/3424_1 /TAXON_ID=1104430 /ORGANISM="Chrysoreinhardia sp, Strain CCMP3193" /LENGTH=90 /DNA_ID=CAMNT_0006833745 /DNA_START=114 /DNA_END=383 /DNA_ORIENTATION=+
MTTDSDDEITALKKKIERAEKEIEQVKAPLGMDSTWSGPNPYDVAEWSQEELKARLSALTTGLTERRREKNLLLEARRAERASRVSSDAG